MRQRDALEASHQSSLLKRQVQGSALEYCPAVKYARTVQYVQQQVELQGHQLMSTRSPAGNPQPAANATVAATAAVSTVQQSAATSSTTSRHIVDRVRSGSLTCTQSLTSPRRLTPYPDPPSCSADSVNGPETPASSALDDDEDALKLMELLKLVQQHKEELEQSGEPAVLEALLGTALTDTQAALNVALNAMSLATTMCSNGSPEAADKALEFAEKALTMTVQRLATAQTLVLETVEQQQDQGVQLPEHAAEIAHHLAAAVGSSDDSRPARDSAAAVRGTARDTKNNKLDTCSSTGS